MTDFQRSYFERVVRRTSVQRNAALRAEILLMYSVKTPKKRIARELETSVPTVRKWTERWDALLPELNEVELNLHNAEDHACAVRAYEQKLFDALKDAPRSGTPKCFSAEELAQIVALSCEVLDDSDEAVSHRTQAQIAQEAVNRNIVGQISQPTVCRILKNRRSQAA